MVRHDLARALVQVAGAAVVTQPAPQAQHIVQRRRSQGGHIGEALQKAGFSKVEVPETQLFPGEINRVSLYRKEVRAGEALKFKKMVLLVTDGISELRELR